MKVLKNMVLFFIVSCLYSSCNKNKDNPPNANFYGNKTEYIAGDTLHLKNASTYADFWEWTLPDGTISHEKNLDYITDTNELSSSLTFTLVAGNKTNKTSSKTKSIPLYQHILPSDYFSLYAINFSSEFEIKKPTKKLANTFGSNWRIQIISYPLGYPLGYYDGGLSMFIVLAGATRPIVATSYLIQNSNVTNNSVLAPNQAYIQIEYTKHSSGDPYFNCNSLCGLLNVSISKKGEVNAVFDSIKAQRYVNNDTIYYYLSGNITCY